MARKTLDPGTDNWIDNPDEAQPVTEEVLTRRQAAMRDHPSEDGSGQYSAGRGWAAHKRHQQRQTGGFTKNFQVPEGDDRVIKILDEEPFESFYRHWLRNKSGKQTYVCIGEGCPLCEIGDSPGFVVLFNVVDLTEDDRETIKVWEASPNPASVIEEFAFSKNHSPINRDDLYFSVTKKKGSNGFFSYSMVPVKARDLPDDWDLQPLNDLELAKLAKGRHGPEYIRADTRSALREVADGLDAG